MVLHDISNNAKLIKIYTTTLCTEWLLERDLNVVYVMPVPGSTKKLVTESKDEDILYHLLSKVVVNAEQFILFPVWFQ